MAFALSVDGIHFDLIDPLPSRVARIGAAAGNAMRGGGHPDGEYNLVFDLSGSESGLRAACEHTRSGGKLCSMSHLDGYASADFLLAALTRRDITFTVSYLNGERDRLRAAATMLEQEWSSDWDEVIGVVPFGELPDAFEARREAPWCKTLVEIARPKALGDEER
jgi:threonine dehydrogenase-like Zn-dependent dehydrogenase